MSKRYTDYKFIGEEESAASDAKIELTDAPTWIIDPVDGTTNFISGLRCSCVLISLAVNRHIQIAVILDPLNLELFYAEKGNGAWYQKLQEGDLTAEGDKLSIETSKKTDLSEIVVINDVGYQRGADFLDLYFKTQKELLAQCKIRGLRTLGELLFVSKPCVLRYSKGAAAYLWHMWHVEEQMFILKSRVRIYGAYEL